ncbi:MAG: LPS-assembly protein LptD, partial [Muribaculaceae bacterium]|nr:LPS-assembly protein LptD [Muribaculaceae bacterium]
MSPDGPLEIADSVWGREYLAADSLLTDSLFYNDSTAYVDSLGWQLPNDRQSLFADDSLPGTGDRTRLSKIVRDKVDLDGSVQFSAKDSLIMLGNNNAYLYGEGKVEYQAFKLASAEIRMELDSSTVYATGVYDSLGNLSGTPVFQDGGTEYESKQMKYNFRTERGYITDVITEQGEGYLTGGRTKKMEDGSFFIADGKYTTCDDHEHPHFYFQVTRGKMRPKKDIVTGPVYMVLADVPLPIAMPFGYFPFTKDYSS